MRYLPPEDDELRALAKLPSPKPPSAPSNGGHQTNKRNRRNHGDSAKVDADGNEIFHVPRNLDVQLYTAPVSMGDLVQLR